MPETKKSLHPVGGKFSKLKQENDVNKLMLGRVQPQAIPLEEAVLGAIIIDKDSFTAVVDILKKESFYKTAHQTIYAAMQELFHKQLPIDLLTVHEQLSKSNELEEIGGERYLLELSNKVASAANVEYHARIISQKFIQRELIRVSTTIIKDSFEDTKDVLDLLDEAESNLYEIGDKNVSKGSETIASLAAQARKQIEDAKNHTEDVTGVTTGFTELDKMTNGWQPSDLIIIAARPGMGKTAFTLSLAKNAAENDQGVAVFSLEMSSVQLVNRLLAMESRVDSQKLRNGQLDDEEWNALNASVDKLSELPIYIDDTPALNIFELRAKCRRFKQNHDIQMIIIDYLQLMAGAPGKNSGNREQEISSISRALKGLAKELNVPVIALSQLSRAVETRSGDKRPMLSDLRESGAIEQDADIVTFIYRPDYYDLEDEFEGPKDMAEIILSKHRNGSLGTVQLKFIPHFVLFTDPDLSDTFDPSGGMSPMSNDIGADPFADGAVITRPSKMNDMDDDVPFG